MRRAVIGPDLIRTLATVGEIVGEMASDGDEKTLDLRRAADLREAIATALEAIHPFFAGEKNLGEPCIAVFGYTEARRREYWELYRGATPGLRTPGDWACERRTGPEEDAGYDWGPEDFPSVTARELILLGYDVMDQCPAGPDPWTSW